MRQRVGLTVKWMYKINTKPQVSKTGLENKISRKLYWLHLSRAFAFECFGWLGAYYVFLCSFASISLAFQILLSFLWAACFVCKYQGLFLFQKDMRWGCVGPDPSSVLLCLFVVRRLSCGVVTRTKQLLVVPRLTAKISQGLSLFANTFKTGGAAPPKSTLKPVRKPVLAEQWCSRFVQRHGIASLYNNSYKVYVCIKDLYKALIQGPGDWLHLQLRPGFTPTFNPVQEHSKKFGPRQQSCCDKRSGAQSSLGSDWVLSKLQGDGSGTDLWCWMKCGCLGNHHLFGFFHHCPALLLMVPGWKL